MRTSNPVARIVPDPARQRKEEALRQFDQNRDIAEFEAALGSWERDDAKSCETMLRSLLERNPKHRDARLLLCEVCLTSNRTQEAFEHAQQALQAHPGDPHVQYTMGLLLDAASQPREALAYYERAAQAAPDNEVFAVGYHSALEAASEPGIATVSAPPKAAGSAAQRGSSGRTGSAENTVTGPAQGLLQRGTAALQQGSPEVALVYFREAAAVQPHNPQVLISAATAALRYDQPALAIELIRPAEKRFSNSAPLKRILGVAYYRTGDYRSSQVALQQALSLDNTSALAYFSMGCTLAKLGQSEPADAHFRQARAIDPRYTVQR